MLPDTTRWQRFMRDAIIEPVIARGIFSLVQIRKSALFRRTLELALHYPAQCVSYQNLIGRLQEAGNVSTVQNYLQILEATFMLKLVPKFTGSAVRKKSSSPKIMPLAPALLHVFKSPTEFETNPAWRGWLIEAAVGTALLRCYEKVFYSSKQHAEIDFIVRDGAKLYAIEVKSGRLRKNYGTNQFLREWPEAMPVIISERELPVFLETGNLPAFIASEHLAD